jgi:hypothetical protein
MAEAHSSEEIAFRASPAAVSLAFRSPRTHEYLPEAIMFFWAGKGFLITLHLLATWVALVLPAALQAADAEFIKVGAQGVIGCNANPQRVSRLSLSKAGVYENYLVDGEWDNSTLVKIKGDNVTLRNSEIRNGKHNAINVSGSNVTIESCKIHHVLNGSFSKQADAHGITGQPTKLVIRNCDIGLTSGDCIQFDPGRAPWDDVLVENCTLWTGPLPADAGAFKKGERPGENGVDTKQRTSNPRSKLVIRNCLFHGFKQPGQIGNLAALNLKNHIQATVSNCVFRDNEICFRVRGGTGEYGGAQVTIENCAVYDSQVGVRAEDKIENLKILRLGIGSGIQRELHAAGGGTGSGYENAGGFKPPAYETVLKQGLPTK